MPDPVAVRNAGGTTLVTNAGCNGKFLAVLDLDIRNRHVAEYQIPSVAGLLQMLDADKDMAALIGKVRAPYEDQLGEKLAVSEGAALPAR